MITKAEKNSDESDPDVPGCIDIILRRGNQILQDALARRKEVMTRMILKEHEEEEIFEQKRRELEALGEEVEQLAVVDENLQGKLEELLYKVTVAEEMKAVKVEESKVQKLTSDIQTLEEDIQRLEGQIRTIQKFENQKGIKMRAFTDGKFVLSFTKIEENAPSKEYRVYIPYEVMANKSCGKYVEKIDPWIAEFGEFTGEQNQVASLKEFLPHIRFKLIEAVARSCSTKPGRRRWHR